ncbi:hypothetical protein H4R33_004882 [Dimargaris cristalligena]|nr:hypothetical protein H4R33_004882 [Dimargaris cristalligena]
MTLLSASQLTWVANGSPHNMEELGSLYMREGIYTELASATALSATLPQYLISDLDLLPDDTPVVIIGDVHGCIKELNQLIEIITNQLGDNVHYIFAGDMVAKGPGSAEVVAKAIELNASCVRGNHDQRVLTSRYFQDRNLPIDPTLPSGLGIKETHWEIAQAFSPEAIHYLQQCPLVLKLPAQYQGLVVHAGVNPTKSLANQTPVELMTMRNMLGDQAVPIMKEGRPWFDVWEEAVANNKIAVDFEGLERIYYGHAASRRIQDLPSSLGLDSACVTGGQLTAVILPGNQLVSVDCDVYGIKIQK